MKMSNIIQIYSTDHEQNDKLVNQFAESNFNVDLDVYGEFVTKQIYKDFFKIKHTCDDNNYLVL